MRRGELWTYVRPSRPDRVYVVVITSSDGINGSTRPWLLGCRLREAAPGDILAVPIPGHGWAYAGDLGRLLRAWLRERIGQLDNTILHRLDNVMRVAQDL